MVKEVSVDDGRVKGVGRGQRDGASALGAAKEGPDGEALALPQRLEIVVIKLETEREYKA